MHILVHFLVGCVLDLTLFVLLRDQVIVNEFYFLFIVVGIDELLIDEEVLLEHCSHDVEYLVPRLLDLAVYLRILVRFLSY